MPPWRPLSSLSFHQRGHLPRCRSAMRIMTGVARVWLDGHIEMVTAWTVVVEDGRIRAIAIRLVESELPWMG